MFTTGERRTRFSKTSTFDKLKERSVQNKQKYLRIQTLFMHITRPAPKFNEPNNMQQP